MTAPRALVIERSLATLVVERGGPRPFAVERAPARALVIERMGILIQNGAAVTNPSDILDFIANLDGSLS
jgi:hypothetical protein